MGQKHSQPSENSISTVPCDFTQVCETLPATVIVMHKVAEEVSVSKYHPGGALYQEVPDVKDILENFQELEDYLKTKNIKVITVKDALAMDKKKLKTLAFESLTYQPKGEFTERGKPYLSNEYKWRVIDKFTDEQLVETILNQPLVTLTEGTINTFVVTDSIQLRPLGNLFFCRDQQITTANGIVITRMNALQRARENDVMQVVWENLNAKVIGRVTGEGRLEGGDYIPAKKDLSMLGIGVRTNKEAAGYLMENDLFGHKRVALIVDHNDMDQERMHLDTFFNIVSENECVLLDFASVGAEKDIRRTVELYEKKDTQGDFGKYHHVNKGETVYFETFLEKEGYTVIPVTNAEQEAYMINFLHIGNNEIITVNPDLEKKLKEAGSTVRVKYTEFGAARKMYGALHCATQAFRDHSAVIEGDSNPGGI